MIDGEEAATADDCVLDAIKSAFNKQGIDHHFTTTDWCVSVEK